MVKYKTVAQVWWNIIFWHYFGTSFRRGVLNLLQATLMCVFVVYKNRLWKHTKQNMDRYRSGHNGPDSKSGSRASGSWVRIPPCPPTKPLKTKCFQGLFLFDKNFPTLIFAFSPLFELILWSFWPVNIIIKNLQITHKISFFNKRTSVIFANHYLIAHGGGFL